MDYNFVEIEKKWQKRWSDNDTYKVTEDFSKEKFYILDMFPYPSGAGLHVGHPLGYIASDVLARYKRHRGKNVLHPMGFDSFGLPAEQYAIQTGQHPAITTEQNITRYKQQLKRIGFSYDWSREIRTSDPGYYKWTQWIFSRLYNSWYNKDTDKAEPIDTLVKLLETNGTYNVNAAVEADWHKKLESKEFHFGEHFAGELSSTDWKVLTPRQKELILQNYRLAYLSDAWVNWCEALGTVLANDEVKDGLSERGGHPVEQKLMRQWSLRITAYADRLLRDLDRVAWSDAIKEVQRNWIGRSQGAAVKFDVANTTAKIEVFTTRPDTIFGVSFIVLAPEHPLVEAITTREHAENVRDYVNQARKKSELDRQNDIKNLTGVFTGGYATHPFTGEMLPIWIGDYVLAGYGTGAVMAVPAGDQRDFNFARAYQLPIPHIFEDIDISAEAYSGKEAVLKNSGFLTGMEYQAATAEVVAQLEAAGAGFGKVNYRLRDAIFSRQRYWGEPFPVYYKNNLPYVLGDEELPLSLPPVDKYLPTSTGEPPLARADKNAWPVFHGDRMEYNTMPGWAGSSWYFLRYMDPANDKQLVAPEKADYWGPVDLYFGGAEHATGHLLYARFWTKFLFDIGRINFEEPFARMINQGMILGKSAILLRDRENPHTYVSFEKQAEYLKAYPSKTNKAEASRFQHLRIDIKLAHNDVLDKAGLKQWQPDFEKAIFYPAEGKFILGSEVEKMSKRWHNVVDPYELCQEVGADTFRLYEMFLGPLEQYKPWDTQGISGVHNFLRKFWRLCHDRDNNFAVEDREPSAEELKILHKTIKKVSEDLERHAFNTVVSSFMICINELSALGSNNKAIIEQFVILLSPYAPHIAEEIWEKLGHAESVTKQPWPEFEEKFLVESTIEYPVSFNGKMRFKIALPAAMTPSDVEAEVLNHELSQKHLEGKKPKKIIVVPGRIVNVVV